MRKNNAKRVGVAVMALLGMSAWAGYKANSMVSVYTYAGGSGYAYGSLASARNSPDSVQYIGCDVFVYINNPPEIVCSAQTANGTYAGCYSNDPGLVAVAQSVKGDSMLSFSWNVNSECDHVAVGNLSHFAPKNP